MTTTSRLIRTRITLLTITGLLALTLGQGCPSPSGGGGTGGTTGGGGGTTTLPVLPGASTIQSVAATGAVVGGQGLLRITLVDPVSADTVVSLSSSDPTIAAVPASATVPADSDSVDVAFSGVAPGQVNITAQLASSSRATPATVVPEIRIVSFFGPSALQTGASTSLNLNLNISAPSDVVVNLASSSADVIPVPATITVPAFSSQQLLAVTAAKTGTTTFTATLGTSTAAFTADVVATPNFTGLSVSPSGTVLVGAPLRLFANLSAIVAADTAVALTSSNPAVLAVPGNITVPANSSSAQIPLTALSVGETIVTGSLNGNDRTFTVQVVSTPLLIGLSVSPSTVEKGQTVTIQVQLNVNTVSDTAVTLTSSNPAVVAVPGSLTVQGGQALGSISVTAADVGTTVVSATLGNSTQSVNLLVIAPSTHAPVLASAFVPSTLAVGTSGQMGIALTGNATADTPVTISNSNTAAISVPASAIIPVGNSFIDVPVQALSLGTATIKVTVGSSSFTLAIQTVTPTLTITSLFASNPHVGFSTSLSINLSETVTTDTTIALTNSAPAALDVPTSAVVLSGHSGVSVPITGKTASTATITATVGASTSTFTVTVLP